MRATQFLAREKYVAQHAQPLWLRIIKFPIILAIAIGLGLWRGWIAVSLLLLFCVVTGTIFHFVLRWGSRGWTRSWGPYKKIDLPEQH